MQRQDPLLLKRVVHTIKRVRPMVFSHNSSGLEMHVFSSKDQVLIKLLEVIRGNLPVSGSFHIIFDSLHYSFISEAVKLLILF